MKAGAANKWVTLAYTANSQDDADWAPLSPAGMWASIEPLPASGGTERTSFHLIRMRSHPEMTVDVRIQYEDPFRNRTRSFFVRDLRDVNEATDEMQLFCEEVWA